LEKFTSAKELEVLGIEELKNQLSLRGLLCGGTLEQRSSRLFSVRGLQPYEISPKLKISDITMAKNDRKVSQKRKRDQLKLSENKILNI